MTGKLLAPCYISKALLVVSILLLSSFVWSDQKPYAPESIDGVTMVSAEELVEMILADPGLLVIDSRKKSEYLKGHIEGAINMLNTKL
ncbi:rhodanese-like domain-containing protein, partial [Thiolapillus sp.]